MSSRLQAHIGGYTGPSYSVEVDSDVKVTYVSERKFYDRHAEMFIPDPGRLTRLLNSLLTELDQAVAKEGKTDFFELILDGTSWSIELHHKGRSTKLTGSNGYPHNWRRICRIIREIAGGREFS